MKENVLREKSMKFAVRVVNLCKYLEREKQEKTMSQQLLRSGTSIGANVREGIYAQSRKDFVAKMSIALKEASETEYWLELLKETNYMNNEAYESISADCGELARLLIAIIRSSKAE